ncbi:hypothetical protein BOTBODRAFT_182230 [Botryobasidium botryosum FD-172 SS1]|uniref:Uncharacterized protein n=1 Tax=Botryobasidium botryosum (strain FD-172 SS1) TaxID=930990 RepID=A0A067M2J7_BOTB1|nr:hypothetical protein BOTBODRAFT_182230 [Botryobasidium botryosum FD-172 SS1]
MSPREQKAYSASKAARAPPQNQTPTYANCFLVAESGQKGLLWENEAFMALSGLTAQHFLHPDYPLTEEQKANIAAWHSRSRNDPAVLRLTSLRREPCYKDYMLAVKHHFHDTVDLAILALMHEGYATPVLARWDTKASPQAKLTAGDFFHSIQFDLAYLLLGDQALYPRSTCHLRPEVHTAVKAIHFRLWERLVKQEATCTTRIRKEMDKLPELMGVLRAEDTPRALRVAARAVAALVSAHEALTLDLPASVAEARVEVTAFLEQKAELAKKADYKDPLWTESQVQTALEFWHEAFVDPDEFTLPPPPGEPLFAEGDLGATCLSYPPTN